MSEEKISRRKYMKYAGAAIAAGAVAAAGYGIYQYSGQPSPTSPTSPSPTSPVIETPATGKKIKIGGTKPFTGPDALFGIAEGRGNELWAKLVNEAGGIKAGDGNTYEVELVLYNDEQKPENVPRLYEKLITEDKVDLLFGPVWGPLGMATVPIVEKYRKFEVYGTCSFDPAVYQDWKYIVHVITNGPGYMNALTDMIISKVLPNDPEAKNLAVTHGDDMFSRTVGIYGHEYALEKGMNVVFYDSYGTATTDLTPIITRAKANKPSIFLNAAAYAAAILLVKQIKELDLNVKMLWPGTGAVFPKFYETLGKDCEGIVTCTQWEPGVLYNNDYGPSHDEFIDEFQKEHNELPDYTTATGFQQGLVMQKCMEECSQPRDSDAMRQVAGQVNMTTFYGKYKVDPNTGWQIGHEMSNIQWQNAEKKVVWVPGEESPSELIYPLPRWSER
ncbi:amino acid ABC transporter substrate-binding protein [[Eubacterium] cellulosolvens]